MYCPHRWGLMQIDRAWAENAFVTKANLIHKRVHDPDNYYALRGKKVFTSVSVFNDAPEYGLYGVVDCIELTPDKNGVNLQNEEQKYRLTIVEYKPTLPKDSEYNLEDLMQVFAQKICVDSVFGCNSEGILYYADKKKRVKLPLNEEFSRFDGMLRSYLKQMRENFEAGRIPPVVTGQKCSGCSMEDICMPKIKIQTSVQKLIEVSEDFPL